MNSSNAPTTFFSKMQNRLAVLFVLLAVLISALTIFASYGFVRNQFRQDYRQRLLDNVRLAISQVDGGLHATLVNPEQETGPTYAQMVKQLRAIRAAGADFRYVYTMRYVSGQVIFVVDAEENLEEVSHLGDAYESIDPALLPVLANLAEPAVDEEFTEGQWGVFLSAYAPIKTSDGRVDGILGIDVDASTVMQRERRLLLLISVYFIFMVPIITLFGLWLGRSLARPLYILTQGALQIARGDLAYRVNVSSHDETAVLAEAFNQMAERLERMIQDLEGRVVERTRQSERRSEYLQAAADVVSATLAKGMGASQDIEKLVSQTVEIIRERFGLYYVGLFLLDETQNWAVLRAGTGPAGRRMLARGHRIRVGEGMVGWSIANSEARIALEAEQDALRLAATELPDTRSEATIPLRSGGRVLGALTVQSDQPGVFDHQIVLALQTMVDQVATALENARLYTESQQAIEALQASYRQLTQQSWQEFLAAEGRKGIVYDERGIHPITDLPGDGFGAGAEYGEAMTDGRGGAQAVRQFEVKVRGFPLGTIQAAKPGDQPWTAQETAIMESLADQLGVVLDNARLYSATQRGAARERVLSEITASVRSSTNVNIILQNAMQRLAEVLNLSVGSIQLRAAAPGAASTLVVPNDGDPLISPRSPYESPGSVDLNPDGTL